MFNRIWKIIQISIIILTVVFGILFFFIEWFKYLFLFFIALSFFEMFINSYKKNKIGYSILYLVLGIVFLVLFVIML